MQKMLVAQFSDAAVEMRATITKQIENSEKRIIQQLKRQGVEEVTNSSNLPRVATQDGREVSIMYSKN